MKPDEVMENLAEIDVGAGTVQTPEQAAFLRASACASRLQQKKKYGELVTAMITLRQCYAVAYRHLTELIDTEENVEPMTLDLFVQSAMHAAAKPFNEHEVVQSLVGVVLPWFGEVLDEHTKKDQAEVAEARRQRIEARKKQGIPLPFKSSLEDEKPELSRQRSLVLAGWRPAILWLIDQVLTHLQKHAPDLLVIRLCEQAPPKRSQANLIYCSPDQWTGCADSQQEMPRRFGSFLANQVNRDPDLVICDQLPLAYTKSFVGRAEGATAGDAHRNMRKWCDRGNCAFLGAVCWDDPTVLGDVTGPEYEQLKTFSTLRGISAVENKETNEIRILFGNHIAVFDVPAATLEPYKQSTLYKPEGGKIIT